MASYKDPEVVLKVCGRATERRILVETFTELCRIVAGILLLDAFIYFPILVQECNNYVCGVVATLTTIMLLYLIYI